MTNDEAQIVLGNIPLKPEVLDDCYSITEYQEAKAMAIEALGKELRWIPVSERLPEDNGYYLTTTMFGEVYCDYWTECSFDRQETVIAWMPLPKPYKAESEARNEDRT